MNFVLRIINLRDKVNADIFEIFRNYGSLK